MPPRLPAPYLQLLGALLLQVCILALAPPAWIQQGSNLLLTVWMAAALATLTGDRRDLWAFTVLGWAPAVLQLVVPASSTPEGLQVAKEVLWAAFSFLLAARLLLPLFETDDVGHGELAGAVAVYVLLGVGFADVYEIIEGLDPAAISFSRTALGEEPVLTDFLYFSFVTLATLGYGDVAPVSPGARLTAVLQSLLGLLYVSILVGRMVGLHTAGRGAGRRP